MIKSAWLLFFMFFPILVFGAGKGFDLYVEGNYEKAWNHYTEKFENNDLDPLAAYNLGVISERFKKPGLAVYFYIQTLQRAPGFSEAANNLSVLSGEINVKIPEKLLKPEDAVDITLIIFFASLYVFALLFSILCFKPDWRIKIALLPLFLIMTVSSVLYFFKYSEAVNENWAVSVEDSSLHSGPDGSLTEVARVRAGEILVVENISGNWYKVKGFNDNVEGWAEMSNIRRIIRGSR
jgi:hypothetical protein